MMKIMKLRNYKIGRLKLKSLYKLKIDIFTMTIVTIFLVLIHVL